MIRDVARKCINAEFNPRRLAGVQITLRSPRCSATVFASGKLVCLGCRNEHAAVTACRKIARHLQQTLYRDVRVRDLNINNVTASGALGYRLDLYALSRAAREEHRCTYEPQQFPGLYYRLPLWELKDDALLDSEDAMPSPDDASTTTDQNGNTASQTAAATVKSEKNNATSAVATQLEPWELSTGHNANLQRAANAQSRSDALAAQEDCVTLCLFYSGKCTITGARSEAIVHRAFRRLSALLWQYQDSEEPKSTLKYKEWLSSVQPFALSQWHRRRELEMAEQRVQREMRRRCKAEAEEHAQHQEKMRIKRKAESDEELQRKKQKSSSQLDNVSQQQQPAHPSVKIEPGVSAARTTNVSAAQASAEDLAAIAATIAARAAAAPARPPPPVAAPAAATPKRSTAFAPDDDDDVEWE